MKNLKNKILKLLFGILLINNFIFCQRVIKTKLKYKPDFLTLLKNEKSLNLVFPYQLNNYKSLNDSFTRVRLHNFFSYDYYGHKDFPSKKFYEADSFANFIIADKTFDTTKFFVHQKCLDVYLIKFKDSVTAKEIYNKHFNMQISGYRRKNYYYNKEFIYISSYGYSADSIFKYMDSLITSYGGGFKKK